MKMLALTLESAVSLSKRFQGWNLAKTPPTNQVLTDAGRDAVQSSWQSCKPMILKSKEHPPSSGIGLACIRSPAMSRHAQTPSTEPKWQTVSVNNSWTCLMFWPLDGVTSEEQIADIWLWCLWASCANAWRNPKLLTNFESQSEIRTKQNRIVSLSVLYLKHPAMFSQTSTICVPAFRCISCSSTGLLHSAHAIVSLSLYKPPSTRNAKTLTTLTQGGLLRSEGIG